jgi:hypothetical protein
LNLADVETHWAKLIGYMEEGRVVPFVGSGSLQVDDGKGGTSSYYARLAVQLAERLDVSSSKLPAGTELNEIACRHMAARGDIDDIYSTLFVLARDEKLPVPEPLLQLASIPAFRLFVTTTFAGFVERAVNQVRFPGGPGKTEVLSYTLTKFDDLRGPVSEAQRPVVYHLLGKLAATQSFAVTNEDILEFIRALLSAQRVPPRLYSELEPRALLILGCRFHDWLARFFLRCWRNVRFSQGGTLPVFVADQSFTTDKNLLEFFRSFSRGITVFPMGPVEFISELHQRWTTLHPDAIDWRSFHGDDGRDKRPFVFISYASEDLTAAASINSALNRAGVDTFFDKEGLVAGENWATKLRNKIEQCALFVVVISQNVLTDGYFRKEWNMALDVFESSTAFHSRDPDDVFLVPIAIDGTSAQDPRIPEVFAKVQWSRLPAGKVSGEFVTRLKHVYRRAQQQKVGFR